MTATVQISAAAASAVQSNMDKLTPLQAELLSRVDAILGGISSAVNKTSAFAGEQIPEIAFQYVAWGQAYMTSVMLIGLAIFIVGIWLAVKPGFGNSYNLRSDSDGFWHALRILSVVGGLIVMVAGGITMIVNLKETIMVWFAPKVWLLQEIVNLVRMVNS